MTMRAALPNRHAVGATALRNSRATRVLLTSDSDAGSDDRVHHIYATSQICDFRFVRRQRGS